LKIRNKCQRQRKKVNQTQKAIFSLQINPLVRSGINNNEQVQKDKVWECDDQG